MTLLPVWIALGAIFGYEILALIFGWTTWSILIYTALRGHPIRATVIFVIVILLAGHVIFGWFNRHRHPPPSPPPVDGIVYMVLACSSPSMLSYATVGMITPFSEDL